MLTPIFASGKFVELIFAIGPTDAENPKKVTKLSRKSMHHYVLVWDKEIPPSDQNNVVRNLAEPRF